MIHHTKRCHPVIALACAAAACAPAGVQPTTAASSEDGPVRVARDAVILTVQRGRAASVWLGGEVYRDVASLEVRARDGRRVAGVTTTLGAFHGGGRWATIALARDTGTGTYAMSAYDDQWRLLRTPVWVEVVTSNVAHAIPEVDPDVIRAERPGTLPAPRPVTSGPLHSFCYDAEESIGFAAQVEIDWWGPQPTGAPRQTLTVSGAHLPEHSEADGEAHWLDVHFYDETDPEAPPLVLPVLHRSQGFIEVELPDEPRRGELVVVAFGVGDGAVDVSPENPGQPPVEICPPHHVAFEQVLDPSYSVIEAPTLVPDVAHWSSDLSATQNLDVVVEANEEVSDIALEVKIQRRLHGGAWGPLATLTAAPVAGQPLRFRVDGSSLGPNRAEELRYWWQGSLTREDGTTLELASANRTFHVDCPAGPTPDFEAMRDLMSDHFAGPMSATELFDLGYLQNNHGPVPVQGLGVSLIFFPEYAPTWLSAEDAERMPEIVFMMPSDPDAVLTDHTWDYPYELVGWGYGLPFVPLLAPPDQPATGCVPYHEWFIHEAGWHTPDDGGMFLDPTPLDPDPADIPPAALDLGATPLNYHPRIWDTHYFWDGPGTTPWMAIYNYDDDGDLLPSQGAAPPAGMFFYPN